MRVYEVKLCHLWINLIFNKILYWFMVKIKNSESFSFENYREINLEYIRVSSYEQKHKFSWCQMSYIGQLKGLYPILYPMAKVFILTHQLPGLFRCLWWAFCRKALFILLCELNSQILVTLNCWGPVKEVPLDIF